MQTAQVMWFTHLLTHLMVLFQKAQQHNVLMGRTALVKLQVRHAALMAALQNGYRVAFLHTSTTNLISNPPYVSQQDYKESRLVS